MHACVVKSFLDNDITQYIYLVKLTPSWQTTANCTLGMTAHIVFTVPDFDACVGIMSVIFDVCLLPDNSGLHQTKTKL